MRRLIVVLTITALLAAMSLTAPAGAQEEFWGMGSKGEEEFEEPRPPECNWYGPWEWEGDWYWEYWCFYHGWGWEFVLWVWD